MHNLFKWETSSNFDVIESSPFFFAIRGTNAATTSNGTNGSATNKQGVLGALERFHCVSVVSWLDGKWDFFWGVVNFFW